jgi:hypothetical protein
LEGSHPLAVLYVDVVGPIDAVEGEVVAVDLPAAVVGSVVYDYYLVVRIILGEDGVEVVLDAAVGVVVVPGHHDAHRQLLSYVSEVEFIV